MKAVIGHLQQARYRGLGQATIAVLIAGSLLLAGCGGGGSSSGPPSDRTSPEGSASFLVPGSPTNKLVEFGNEASSAVRSEASEVLTKSLEAREEAAFGTQCATLTKEQVEQIANAKGAQATEACPKELRALAEPLPSSKPIRTNELSGPITALRVKRDKAYALFHGKDSDDYAVPMLKEGGEWKVAAITLTKLGVE